MTASPFGAPRANPPGPAPTTHEPTQPARATDYLDPFPHPRLWQFTLGTVVTWIKSFQVEGNRRDLGHVVGFAQDPNALPLIRVRWQSGDNSDVPPGYLRLEKDRT